MLSSRVMQFTRVPNRFFGIRDLAYFKVGIRDFEGNGGRDIRDCNLTGTRDMAILTSGSREMPLERNRDSGIPKTEISKENQAVILLWSEIAEQ